MTVDSSRSVTAVSPLYPSPVTEANRTRRAGDTNRTCAAAHGACAEPCCCPVRIQSSVQPPSAPSTATARDPMSAPYM